jgi:hypothetical protein
VGSKIDKLALNYVPGDMTSLTKVLPTLCKLALGRVQLTLDETQLLANVLTLDSSRLKSLQLNNCGLTNDHLRTLSPCLGQLTSMSQLQLEGNQIGDDGVAAFVEHWSLDSQIEKLDLSGNDIQVTGVQHLVTAMANRAIKLELNLSYNHDIGFQGITLLGQAVGGRTLSKLDLSEVVRWKVCHDDTSEDAVAQKQQRRQACQALLEGVWENVFLTSLTLENNFLPIPVMDELELVVIANQDGRELLLEQNALPPAFWCHLLAIQAECPSLMFLFLRELPSLMVSQPGNLERKRRRVDV